MVKLDKSHSIDRVCLYRYQMYVCICMCVCAYVISEEDGGERRTQPTRIDQAPTTQHNTHHTHSVSTPSHHRIMPTLVCDGW